MDVMYGRQVNKANDSPHIIQHPGGKAMKTPVIVSILALLMLLPGLVACGSGGVEVTAKLNSPRIHTDGGTLYLQLSLHAPKFRVVEHRPVNLAIVLDRSGSMGERGKMENAKRALYSLIDRLDERDVLSIVIYDDVIEVLRSAGPVGNKERIKNLVREIQPRGSTNLAGGMCEGFRQAEQRLDREYVNRVVLLSDGLANTGLTDPQEIGRIARRYRQSGISLTTMGVGLDYNENLMVSMAENGGGNYYYIESPHSLAEIMRKEFSLMSTICVRNAVIELSLGRGVHVKDVIGYDWNIDNGTCKVAVGDLYANEERELTLELAVPNGHGSLTLAEGQLRHDERDGVSTGGSFAAAVQYTEDAMEVERTRDLQVQAKADVAVSTRAVNQATQALDEGKSEEASRIIQNASEALKASPAAAVSGAGGALMQEQSGRLQDYKDIIQKGDDARKTKKEIQYRNYQVQKNKQ
jgi:Ca-activated chloride channel family protein